MWMCGHLTNSYTIKGKGKEWEDEIRERNEMKWNETSSHWWWESMRCKRDHLWCRIKKERTREKKEDPPTRSSLIMGTIGSHELSSQTLSTLNIARPNNYDHDEDGIISIVTVAVVHFSFVLWLRHATKRYANNNNSKHCRFVHVLMHVQWLLDGLAKMSLAQLNIGF